MEWILKCYRTTGNEPGTSFRRVTFSQKKSFLECDFKNSKFDFQGLSIIGAEIVNTNRYLNKDEMDNEYVMLAYK